MQNKVEKLKFKIAYTGPAVEGGEMDILSLGRSLSALGQLFKISNSLISNDESQVTVKLKHTGSGSIELSLEAMKQGYELAQSFGFDSTDIASLGSIVSSLGFTPDYCKGLFDFYLHLKGQSPKSVKHTNNGVQIENNNGVVQNFNNCTFLLSKEVEVVEQLKNIMEPVKNDSGFVSFEVREGKKTVVSVNKEEAHYFRHDDEFYDDIRQYEYEIGLNILRPVYDGTAQWEFREVDTSADRKKKGPIIKASIRDVKWVKEFQRNEVQAPPGTVLRVRISRLDELDKYGYVIKSKYVVQEVIETMAPGIQEELKI